MDWIRQETLPSTGDAMEDIKVKVIQTVIVLENWMDYVHTNVIFSMFRFGFI